MGLASRTNVSASAVNVIGIPGGLVGTGSGVLVGVGDGPGVNV